MKNSGLSIWLARIPVLIVFIFNIQCAVLFLLWPARYAPAFVLSGSAGDLVVRGMGILFLMWNVPYFVALLHPVKHITSLKEAAAMQFIGGFGETLLYLNAVSPVLRGSIARFMLFDWGGLILLIAALWLAAGMKKDALKAVSA
jgi:hypothetical protein